MSGLALLGGVSGWSRDCVSLQSWETPFTSGLCFALSVPSVFLTFSLFFLSVEGGGTENTQGYSHFPYEPQKAFAIFPGTVLVMRGRMARGEEAGWAMVTAWKDKDGSETGL